MNDQNQRVYMGNDDAGNPIYGEYVGSDAVGNPIFGVFQGYDAYKQPVFSGICGQDEQGARFGTPWASTSRGSWCTAFRQCMT